jgi:hypothetical protein
LGGVTLSFKKVVTNGKVSLPCNISFPCSNTIIISHLPVTLNQCLQVDLGYNFMCSNFSWKYMNTCLDIADWCGAILRGCFGEETAMRFRVTPRYSDLEYFPPNFLDVAKSKLDFVSKSCQSVLLKCSLI